MNKRLDTAIILILILILIGIGISGCAKPSTNKNLENKDTQPNISVYNGTLSQILGCMFAPNECQKLKNKQSQKEPHKDQSEYQDDITKEMTEMDEDISKDNK